MFYTGRLRGILTGPRVMLVWNLEKLYAILLFRRNIL